MEQIKEILNKCFKKLQSDYNMEHDKIRETYYNIYLTSLGVRNGTYVEIFNGYILYLD